MDYKVNVQTSHLAKMFVDRSTEIRMIFITRKDFSYDNF